MLRISFAVFIDHEEENNEKLHQTGIREVGQVVRDRMSPLKKLLPDKIRNVLRKVTRDKQEDTDNEPAQNGGLLHRYAAAGLIEKIFSAVGKPGTFQIDSSVEYICTDAIPEGYTIYKPEGVNEPDTGKVYVSLSYKPNFYFPLSEFDEQVEELEKGIILDMLKSIGAKSVRVLKCNQSGEEDGCPEEKYSFERPAEFSGSRHQFILDHNELNAFQYKNLRNSAPKPDVLIWRETDFGILDDISNELRKKLKKEKQNHYCIGFLHEYHFYIDSFYDKVISEEKIQEKSKALVAYCRRFVNRSLLTTALFIGGALSLLGSDIWEGWIYISAVLFIGSYIFIAIAVVKAVISMIKSGIRKAKGEKKEPWYRKIKFYAKIVEHICEEHEDNNESEIVVSCDKLAKKAVILVLLLVAVFVLLFVLRGWIANHFHNRAAMEIIVMPFRILLSHLQ